MWIPINTYIYIYIYKKEEINTYITNIRYKYKFETKSCRRYASS